MFHQLQIQQRIFTDLSFVFKLRVKNCCQKEQSKASEESNIQLILNCRFELFHQLIFWYFQLTIMLNSPMQSKLMCVTTFCNIRKAKLIVGHLEEYCLLYTNICGIPLCFNIFQKDHLFCLQLMLLLLK